MVDISDIRLALRKLLSFTYYDKSDLILRRNVADFVNAINNPEKEEDVLNSICDVANGKDEEGLTKLLSKMQLSLYPKKLASKKREQYITNVPDKYADIERFFVKAEIPVELMLIDIVWVMRNGISIDASFGDEVRGNRLDLIPNNSGIKEGNYLYKPYQYQYRKWWSDGLRKANSTIKDGQSICIVNFDLKDFYHSVSFDFTRMLSFYHVDEESEQEQPLTYTLKAIYERYWEIAANSNLSVFQGKNKPLPLSLMSAHIFANWYLRELDNYINEKYNPLYYGRYVDDCMLVVSSSEPKGKTSFEISCELLPGLFEKHEDVIRLANINGLYPGLALQEEKLFTYYFDCELSQLAIEKYVQEQNNKCSIFNFATDEEDPFSLDFEDAALINAIDIDDTLNAKFKLLEENKYHLAVYLAKLNERLSTYGDKYDKVEEVEKISRYFQGSLIIKHYQLWEKILTAFVLSNRKDLLISFCSRIQEQIESVKSSSEQLVKETLYRHYSQSLLMAQSLKPDFYDVEKVFLDSFMVRMHYNRFPLQEFSIKYRQKGVDLGPNDLEIDSNRLEYRWLPYYKKLYEIILGLNLTSPDLPDLYDKAAKVFATLNHLGNHGAFLPAIYFAKKEWSEFNTTLAEDEKDDVVVSVVEMDIPDKDIKEYLKHPSKIDYDKINLFRQVRDKVEGVKDTDVFIMPELSLPSYLLNFYCRYSAAKGRAIVTGVEYIIDKNTAHNYILTCLPLRIFGTNDAFPILRLKEHYAPEEKETLISNGFKYPPNSKHYHLYHWRGQVFTTFYCYELANIKRRAAFQSRVDSVYCPVFNKDTYYFNNIAESYSRDIHCYFIMDNVSHYGDARVTRPTSHINMNILKVKGGNTEHNKAVVLSASFDIKELRRFQQLSEKAQMDEIAKLASEKKLSFKLTPPDFNRAIARKRKNRFCHDYDDWVDEFLESLSESALRY